jgi:hypothetical protein
MKKITAKNIPIQKTISNFPKDKAIKLIHKSIHSDFRGTLGGKPSIMLSAAVGGGLATIEDLEDKVFNYYLDSAVDQLNKANIKLISELAFAVNGLINLDEGMMNQWCGSFESTKSLISHFEFNSEDQKQAVLNDLQKFEEKYL